MPEHTNALAGETSPYLLQHAHNPVDWRPWGDDALAAAADADKLMIVSIGYAACHWCHVMERESFEDSTVAAVMNEHYVSVKVDREERPDVDDVYMTACHLTSGGSCGWPLNAIALPDGRPVWAGTYFPRKRWIEVLEYFVRLRAEEPAKLEAYAAQIADSLQASGAQPLAPEQARFDAALTDANATRVLQLADLRRGGLGGAPKFPMPVIYDWLLTHAALGGQTEPLPFVHTTLGRMARGGLYDQLGGGFARYSVDADWHAPHFEKMLYDNAQLLSVYARAYRHSGREEYREIVRQTAAFVERELTGPDGLFYSSLDADSEGEEGKFYVWTYERLRDLLTEAELEAFAKTYGVTPGGNWEHGVNILHRAGSYAEIAQSLGLREAELRQVLAKAGEKVLAARGERVRPGLDDKVLVSWNGLTIAGLVDAYLATGEVEYEVMARSAAQAIEHTFLQDDGRLLRTSAKGKTHVNAFLDDYANLAGGYLALYQATFDTHWLALAQRLVDYALEHFDNPGRALLYYTSDLDPALVARRVEDADNVLPASNSAMAHNLLTLGTILGESRYTERAETIAATVGPSLAEARQPAYWANWLRLHERLARPRYEVAVVGERAAELRLAMARRLTPQAVFIGDDGQRAATAPYALELLEGKAVAGATLIYVCEDRACQRPTSDPAEALATMTRGPVAER